MTLRRDFFLAALVCLCAAAQTPKTAPTATVPFVACASDGQQGPQPAPVIKSRPLPLSSAQAQQLAFYEGQDEQGTLAPIGWHCLQLIGSDGDILYISPTPISDAQLTDSNWKGFPGPAIQLSLSVGQTSGRFAVATTIARVFPKYKSFVTSVIKEQIEPASDFPFGPWPHDQLHCLSDHAVEFTTPANTDGLGTASNLQKNAQPITGVAIYFPGSGNNMVQLFIRLPPELAGLGATLAHQVELDSGQVKQ